MGRRSRTSGKTRRADPWWIRVIQRDGASRAAECELLDLSGQVDNRFLLPDGYVLILPEKAMSTFLAYRQQQGMPEAGGILLGRIYDNRRQVTIEQVTVPGERDDSGKTFFNRSPEAAQEAIDKAWQESGGEQVYLGEWHTHAESFPSPSATDRRMIGDLLTKARLETDFLIMVIVGQKNIWVGYQAKNSLTRLTTITKLHSDN